MNEGRSCIIFILRENGPYLDVNWGRMRSSRQAQSRNLALNDSKTWYLQRLQ